MKSRRQGAILELIESEPLHSQEQLRRRLLKAGFEATQATISRDIQELGLVRSGRGYRSANALVRELVLSVELVQPMAVIKTPPGTANLVARRIDEAALPGIAGTVAGDDTIIAILRQRSAGRALKELLANVS